MDAASPAGTIATRWPRSHGSHRQVAIASDRIARSQGSFSVMKAFPKALPAVLLAAALAVTGCSTMRSGGHGAAARFGRTRADAAASPGPSGLIRRAAWRHHRPEDRFRAFALRQEAGARGGIPGAGGDAGRPAGHLAGPGRQRLRRGRRRAALPGRIAELPPVYPHGDHQRDAAGGTRRRLPQQGRVLDAARPERQGRRARIV